MKAFERTAAKEVRELGSASKWEDVVSIPPKNAQTLV